MILRRFSRLLALVLVWAMVICCVPVYAENGDEPEAVPAEITEDVTDVPAESAETGDGETDPAAAEPEAVSDEEPEEIPETPAEPEIVEEPVTEEAVCETADGDVPAGEESDAEDVSANPEEPEPAEEPAAEETASEPADSAVPEEEESRTDAAGETAEEPAEETAEEPADPVEEPVEETSEETAEDAASAAGGSPDEPEEEILTPVFAEEAADEQNVIPGEGGSSTIDDYIRRLLYGPSKAQRGTVAYYALTENEKRLYNALKPAIAQLAAGERSSSVISIPVSDVYDEIWLTAEELGVERLIYERDGIWYVDENASRAYRARFPLAFQNILSALLFDLPFDLYWQDKTLSNGYTGSAITVVDDRMGIKFTNRDGSPMMLTVKMPVSKDYSVTGETGTYDLDTGYGATVQAAVANAKRIVAENAGKTDLQKLHAYADAICELASYNYDAAGSGNQNYGNPWQVIWVFDGDPDTKVVCEGYAKAFLYLCDLSSFSGNIEVITAAGSMAASEAGHMWNLVTLDDGYQYLVDLTFSDFSSTDLVMRGYTEKNSDYSYVYTAGQRKYTYIFNNPTYNLFHETGHLDPDPFWSIEDGVLYLIDGKEEYTSAANVPWAAYRDRIQDVAVGGNVDKLGSYVLSGLTLRSLRIPSSVKSIAETALAGTTTEQILVENCWDYAATWLEDHGFSFTALHHNLTAHERVEPTLVEPGTEAYWSCDTCGKLFSDAEGENEIDVPAEFWDVTVDAGLNLVDKIGINFFFSMPVGAEKEAYLLHIEYLNKYQTIRRDYPFTALKTDPRTGELCLKPAVYIGSDEMSDEVLLSVFKNGRRIGDPVGFSVQSIANAWLADGRHEPYEELLKAMLQYGHYAELQFEYNENRTAVPEGAPAMVPVSGAYAPKADPSDLADCIEYFECSLALDAAIDMKLYIRPREGYGLNDFSFEVTGPDGSAAVITEPKMVNGEIKFAIREIYPDQMVQDYSIKVTVNGVSAVYRRTVMNFAYEKDRQGKYVNILRALQQYAEAARRVFSD